MPLAAALLLVIQSSNVWLDQTLANWNKAGASVRQRRHQWNRSKRLPPAAA
jgi:hypothetical protein